MNESGENRKEKAFDWRDVVIIIALLAVIFVYFRHLLWTDKYIYGELDIRRQLYFFKKISYELMGRGELPLWIPHIFCGMPLLGASLVTPFYPIDLVFLVTGLPLNMVFNWDLLLHLIAAQVFSYLFFKRLFGRRIPAVFCSMWFWNVFFLNSIDTGDALNIRAMLLVPMVFYFTEASLGEDGRTHNFLFGALALSLQILCGGLQFTFYTMVAVSAYAAFLLIVRVRRGEEFFYQALGFSALIIVALAMASVQLLPSWEYTRLSVRATGIPWFKVWALKPYQLIGYVIPMFEGREREHGYFGLAALVLAAYSLPFWKSPRKHFFLGLGIVAMVYSFGGNTLVSSYLAGLPLVRDFRGPFRAAIMSNLSVFILAGGALMSLLNWDDTARNKRWQLSFGFVSVLIAGGFVATAIWARSYAGWSIATVIVSAAFVTLSILAVFVLLIFSRFRLIAALALVSLLAGDIALNHGGFYSPSPVSHLLKKDWSVDFLKKKEEDMHSRIAVYNTAHTNYFGLFGFESANGHHPFPLLRYALFLPLLKNQNVASLAGVKYNVIYSYGKDGQPHDPPVRRLEEVTITPLLTTPVARAFLVRKYRILPSAEILGTMQESGFDPEHEVILEKSPTGLGASIDLPVVGSATIISREANKVVIETASEHEAILVLSDSYYPGWQAEIDGVEVETLRADYVFRGVPLPEGRHTVVFKFRPRSFFFGAMISCAGVIAWLCWALFFWVRRWVFPLRR